ncbi:Zinc finger BED domain-containing protein 5 [Eumeta japonica]|uniref:Zinc finger BED domain-containing protein 5 n=1 Tax=Eumeta variegata TaxID=151549 RepID=A0A4C2AFJ3_EUMVA|nr:Zinc finger BED domain-containing protein 5 [Eumeta japonica]
MTLNVQKQYARRIQQLPIQTMMPRRQAPRFQRQEKRFSTYAATKTKYCNRLDAEPDMRLQLSSIKPDINQLMKNKKTVSYLPPTSLGPSLKMPKKHKLSKDKSSSQSRVMSHILKRRTVAGVGSARALGREVA